MLRKLSHSLVLSTDQTVQRMINKKLNDCNSTRLCQLLVLISVNSTHNTIIYTNYKNFKKMTVVNENEPSKVATLIPALM